MPKKYLLYIHNHEEFDKLQRRGEKSGLVNKLFSEWLRKKKRATGKKVL